MKLKLKMICLFILLLSTISLLPGCSNDGGVKTASTGESTPSTHYSSRPMPEFALQDVRGGTTVSSSVYTDKVLLVVFFATWCKSCIEEIDGLIQLQNTLGNKEFSVVGLSVDEKNQQAVKSLISQTGINYPVLMTNQETKDSFGGISTIPTFFLVDRNGMIRQRFLNHKNPLSLQNRIEALLEDSVESKTTIK